MAASDLNAASWRQARQNIDAVVDAGERAMIAALGTIGIEAVNVVRIMLTHPGPSLPGEPPGLRYGGLRLSYTHSTGGTGGEHWVDIGSDAMTRRPVTGKAVNYAKFLEFGTSKMAPRPHLRPAMAVVTPTIAPTLVAACVSAQKARAATLRPTTT